MYQTVEAIVKNGQIQPLEAIEYEENTRFLLVRLPAVPESLTQGHVTSARGAYKGLLSSTEEFSRQKQLEKVLEQ